ncbi:MAG: hypothetical protein AAGB15_15670, partial [Pseudomonadota bacterium]
VQSLGMDMVQTFTAADAEVVGQAAEMGITLIKWAPEERQKLRAAAMEIWKQNSEKSADAKRIYESQIQWLTSLGLI